VENAEFWVRALDSPHKHLPIQTIDIFVQNPTSYFADLPQRGVISRLPQRGVVTGWPMRASLEKDVVPKWSEIARSI